MCYNVLQTYVSLEAYAVLCLETSVPDGIIS